MIYNWKAIVKNGLPLLTVAVIAEIFAGQILQRNEKLLITLPIFLISVPVINSVGGNIGSVLGARLASGLHVGYITLSFKNKEMHDNVLISLAIGFIAYFVLGIIIYLAASLGNNVSDIDLIEFVTIIVLTGILLVCVVAIVSVFTAFISFKHGLDPDDMIAPIVTTFGDILGIGFLFLIIGVFGIW